MTTNVDIGNMALQIMGSRTNMASLAESSNEAIQCNLIMFKLRDELNRMAPWNCMTKRANLVYISSTPGTPENSSSGPPMWVPGMPPPPWGYEYQYPLDCLRVRSLIPQFNTVSGGVPLYPIGVVIGTSFTGWMGPALKFEVSIDTFFGVSAAAVNAGGLGYAVGDVITLVQPSYTFAQAGVNYTMPVGAPAQLTVTGIGGGGAVTTVSVVNQVQGESGIIGGSYFSAANPTGVAQGSTTGAGTGATFNLTFITPAGQQRVILCNQEMPIVEYNAQVTDPNVMDPLFQDAWAAILGARLAFQLSGDKAMANQCIGIANNLIMEARKADGNEGITVNDVTPDFLRIRGGWGGPYWESSPNMNFDWGGFYSPY